MATKAQLEAMIHALEERVESLTAERNDLAAECQVLRAKLRPVDAPRRPVTFPRQPFYTAFDRDHATAACRAAARARGHAVSFKPINTPRGIAFALF